MNEKPSTNDSEKPLEMAEEIIDAVEDEQQDEDALTKREREIERKKEEERVKKAMELKKQLRKRELGLLHYRWPALVLILSGILAIWTEFLVVMTHEAGVGFDTFWDVFLFGAFDQAPYNGFFIFPLVAGTLLIVLGFFAYSNPKATYFSAIPAMMMAMAGMNVYFFVSVTLQLIPNVELASTGVPMTMLIVGVLSLISIALREKE
ncbi:MAG: hypothetical protein EAX95_06840 [Candidatus Thorarchaeota archaeon]|nr:hypothetical protein [Candidatus Thorarchaeota archaeon]